MCGACIRYLVLIYQPFVLLASSHMHDHDATDPISSDSTDKTSTNEPEYVQSRALDLPFDLTTDTCPKGENSSRLLGAIWIFTVKEIQKHEWGYMKDPHSPYL
jgi:hypothetical protein